jgi:predicted negative regulator of RcsB-dependent stress response
LAEAYAVKGEKALAIKNYEKSINLNPNNRSAREAVEKLKRP